MDWKPITEVRSVTCHMGSHSVTCHPTQLGERARLNPSHAGWYSIYLPRRDGRLSWPWCVQDADSSGCDSIRRITRHALRTFSHNGWLHFLTLPFA